MFMDPEKMPSRRTCPRGAGTVSFPAYSRFLQTDPIGYEDQVNLYAYVGNDPVNGVDPTGTQCKNDDGDCPSDEPEKEETENEILVTGKRIVSMAVTASWEHTKMMWRTASRVGTAPYNYGLGPSLFGFPKVIIAPEKAYRTLRTIRSTGKQPGGQVGGRKFKNLEGKLPSGEYREYDVDPAPSSGTRSAERIVVDNTTGAAWYTPDHYTTFIKLW